MVAYAKPGFEVGVYCKLRLFEVIAKVPSTAPVYPKTPVAAVIWLELIVPEPKF